ncbi:MAG TPA: hypothetical protein VJU84_18795 [Pyrinomonadaceae bacterium]|nr:hypothetical protein [Pyrinomonadaceae bacterium]
MRSKLPALLLVLLFAPALIRAQDDATRPQVVRLPEGGFVSFKSQSARTDKGSSNELVPTLHGGLLSQALLGDGPTIHRVLQNPKGEYIFGYDLIVLAHADSKKFTITVKPLDEALETKLGRGIPTLREGTQPEVMDDGDSFALDLLVNQNTGVKIVDFVKVSFERSKLGEDKAAPSPRDFTLDAVALKIVDFKMTIGGRQVMTGLRGADFRGALLWCYVEGHGRFIVSLVPRDGYEFEKTGVISDNKIAFEISGRQYEWLSSEPILPGGGAWNVWVLHDPKYVPFGSLDSRKKEPTRLEKLDQAIQSLPKGKDPTAATFKKQDEDKDKNQFRRFKVMAGAADRIENLWPRSP